MGLSRPELSPLLVSIHCLLSTESEQSAGLNDLRALFFNRCSTFNEAGFAYLDWVHTQLDGELAEEYTRQKWVGHAHMRALGRVYSISSSHMQRRSDQSQAFSSLRYLYPSQANASFSFSYPSSYQAAARHSGSVWVKTVPTLPRSNVGALR